jgi:NADH-quinone oxidoreductase subunit I
MPGEVRIVDRPESESSYIRAISKGLGVTFKHFMHADKPTQQYPDEKWELGPRWRGTHRMAVHEDGRAKCVGCGLCPTVCPVNCIKLIPAEDENGERYAAVYEIDEFRCIFCGFCQEVCPVEAIHLGVHYENAEYSRERWVYDLARLCENDHPVTALWDPADPSSE